MARERSEEGQRLDRMLERHGSVRSGFTSTSPLPIRSTASRNSSSKRNVPRSCSSFVTSALTGSSHFAAEAELHDDSARPQEVEGAAQRRLVAGGLEEDVEGALGHRMGRQPLPSLATLIVSEAPTLAARESG